MTSLSSTSAQPSLANLVGGTIQRERRAAGITQEELARHLDVTKAAVSKWEIGQSVPDVALVPRIAAFFGITCDELLGYAEEVGEDERSRIMDGLLEALKRDFDEGFAACKRCERAHWRDWPLLTLMGALLLNRALHRPDRLSEVIVYLDALYVRIEDECPDIARCRTARMTRASLMMLPQEPSRVEEGVALLGSLSEQGDTGQMVPSLLAAAYDQAGRAEDALVLRQRIVYTSGMNAMGECLNQMKGCREDSERAVALAQAARGIARALRLDAATPLSMLSLHVQCTLALKNAGLRDEALKEVESLVRAVDALRENPYAAPHAHEAVLFDAITGDFEQGASSALADMSADMLLESAVAMVLANASWDDCADDPRYQALLARRGESHDAAAYWAEAEAR